MTRLSKWDVLDCLVPGVPRSTWQVARILALRGCLDSDGHDAEARVRRHLARLAAEGRVRRAGRSPDRTALWTRLADEEPRSVD